MNDTRQAARVCTGGEGSASLELLMTTTLKLSLLVLLVIPAARAQGPVIAGARGGFWLLVRGR